MLDGGLDTAADPRPGVGPLTSPVSRSPLWKTTISVFGAPSAANNLQTFTFTGGVYSRSERNLSSLDAFTTVTSQDTVEDSNRFDVTANARRFLANRLFYPGSLSFDGNDELGLELAEAGLEKRQQHTAQR